MAKRIVAAFRTEAFSAREHLLIPPGGTSPSDCDASGAFPMPDRLTPGQSLFTNGSITSGDGRFRLIMQTDGNLVVYRNNDNRALWATGTQGSDVHRAVMQTDGNLVLYHVNNAPAWASNTAGKPGSFLAMQNDGNLVIYQPIVPIWASNTVQ
jgi:hypothetical protein